MARGWESKSVELQLVDTTFTEAAHQRLTSEQAARLRQREGLELSRKRILDQLAVTRDPRHRIMLEQALAELERRLETSPP
ncbi:MAG TPA: hypothetical protein VEI01_19690 [Terriglobales bacterium]|nr:hypothetical protein [Terriglobales bacterium]